MKKSILTLCLFMGLTAQAQLECEAPNQITAFFESTETLNFVATVTNPNTFSGVAGSRMVYWVHGLGGNYHSWFYVGDVFTNIHPQYPVARHIGSSFPLYEEANRNAAIGDLHSIMLSGNSTFDDANEFVFDRNRHFIISHSQGGIVSRFLDQCYITGYPVDVAGGRQFGGLVTFGTSHQGARILNNANPKGPNMIGKFAEEGCNAFAYDGLLNLFKGFLFIAPTVISSEIKEVTENLCESLAGTVLPYFLKDLAVPLTTSYYVGANHIVDLNNNFTHQIPIVLFYGVEEQPVFWRTVHSFITHDIMVLNEEPFGLDDDQPYVDEANSMMATYMLKREQHKSLARYYSPKGVGFWLCYLYGGNAGAALCLNESLTQSRLADANDRVYKWLHGANANWERIIGARETNIVQDGYTCHCQDRSPRNGHTYTYKVNNPSECHPVECYAVPNVTTQTIHKPSDGVVLAESAGTLSEAIEIVEMEDTNHQQMRNCTLTKFRLIDLFDGLYSLYFETDHK